MTKHIRSGVLVLLLVRLRDLRRALEEGRLSG